MRMFFLVFILGYIGGNVYIFIRALQMLSGVSFPLRILLSVFFWLAAFSLVIALLTRHIEIPVSLSKTMFCVGSVWLVFTLYMILSLLLTDVVRLFVPTMKYGFCYALSFTCCLLLYGYYNYLHPQIKNINIPIDKPIEGEGVKIVAVSDLHLGNGTGKAMLKRYVDMINAQTPDLILIGGDLIDNSLIPLYHENMAEELAELKAPMGIYMVPGNHEYISGIDECVHFLKTTPIKLLRDSVVTLPNGVQIIGRDDRSNRSRHSLPELLKRTDNSKPTVVLDHQPYNLKKTDSLGIDLQFSGHTHHGQVWPISWLTDRLYEQSHGYRKWSKSHIYVSSGLSLWGPPFRIGTNSDMAVLHLSNIMPTFASDNH
ncbi:metallophosphoesterase [Bacteroides oleiciplenus]|uniref:metallophosphoesterase n=1 Tax=Bacteroides oleiciplenus TaxID=626931 RepID=UPI0026DAF249|nr:metallophosphoesterase [Bacteroides oleiciplenus]